MKHVSILIPRGHTSITNIEGTYQILNEVNNLVRSMGKEPVFSIQLVGITKEAAQPNGLFTVKPEALTDEIEKTDLIIIPAIHGDQRLAYENNKAFVPWIIQQYKNGAEIATFCIASFFLAGTGLLKGKQCATHWRFVKEFRDMFPDVKLVDNRILTEDSRIYSSGGAYSYINLVVYLVEKYAGRDIAILIAKTFMIDIDRQSQSPFIIFSGQKEHNDEPVKKVQEYIEKNFQDKITVDHLASLYALSRRNLERRFKKATSNTVSEYIQRVKIEAAKKSFETKRENVNEVMYAVGYADNKAFRTTFKKITGLSPIEYRNKYSSNNRMTTA
jgi:transcriptional regulator GlxA family with amidase domain